MPHADRFFSEIQGAAVLKHGILRRYLRVFLSKVGSTSERVVYLDGYAGPGTYDDGSPGSPSLAVRTAEAMKRQRRLEGICVEKDPDHYQRLATMLAGYVGWEAVPGALGDCLDTVLGKVGTDPLFAFLDPFGLMLPPEKVRQLLERQSTTELLINFSLVGLRRNAGHLKGNAETSVNQVAIVDQSLGGDWWRAIWQTNPDPKREQLVVEEYGRHLAGLGRHWSFYVVGVGDRYGATNDYALMLFSRHPHGLWAFNNAVSAARELDYLPFCERLDREKQKPVVSGQLSIDFEPTVEPRDQYLLAIERNVLNWVAKNGKFRLSERTGDVYGTTLGYAREKDVRKVLMSLFSAGKIARSPKGTKHLEDFVVEPS